MKDRKNKLEIKSGLIFSIPIVDEFRAILQIYHPGVVFFAVIYSGIFRSGSYEPLSKLSPILATWTNDAEIFKGRWLFEGEENVPKGNFKEPSYLVTINGVSYVESFDGSQRKLANSDEIQLLNLRKSRSPLLVEDAVRAFNGHGKWLHSFDDMRI